MMAKKNTGPSWSDVKAELINADRDAFLLIIKDLYVGSKENQLFLHTRFGLGEDALKPYKVKIERWLWPGYFVESGHINIQGEESHRRL